MGDNTNIGDAEKYNTENNCDTDQTTDTAKKVNYFIYAKDYSGSTEGNRFYHTNGMRSLEQFHSDVERINNEQLITGEPQAESKIVYLHWGDRCNQVDKNTTVNAYTELKSGRMGTEPATIVKWIQQAVGKDKKIKLLYIITDGLIDCFSAQECFLLNENMFYEMVVFHAFNENMYDIDLSVAASFLKSRCMIYRNYELYDNVDIAQEFDYDNINVDNFSAAIDNLKSYIKLKYINKYKQNVNGLQEIGKLKKLRDQLFLELSPNTEKNRVNLDTKDRCVFLREFADTEWYKNLSAPAHGLNVEIEKAISTLINYIVSDQKSFSFDALKFNTQYNEHVEEEPIVDVNFTVEQEIEFPDIVLDDDTGIPVILLTECNLLDKIIFKGTKQSAEVSPASFNKFKSTMDCPLFLLNDSDISESIGYFYTLNVYKQLLEKTTKTEPRTRRPYHGGLVLTDTDQFDKYNDFILLATYFDFKKVHFNIGLFYFVLFKNCENKEWMDKNVVEQFKKYVMRRISTTVCKIGLSSLPLDPKEMTLLPTALWYCVELSSCIFKDDSQNFMHERLRMYYGLAHCMVEILQFFDYDLDLESIEKRKDLIRHVMTLKKIPTVREKIYYLLEGIFKKVNGFLVSEIENSYNLNKLNYLKFDHKEVLYDSVVDEKVHLNDYVHLLNFIDEARKPKVSEGIVEICKKTFRPFFTIGENKSFYTELVKVTKKVVINNDEDKDKIKISYDATNSIQFHKFLSLFKLFIDCTTDSNKYPTLLDYIEYIHKKKKYFGDLVTIFPLNFYSQAEDVFLSYQNIASKVNVGEFIKVSRKYVNRSERVKAEEIIKFRNDNEVKDFIASEESKVNLKNKLN